TGLHRRGLMQTVLAGLVVPRSASPQIAASALSAAAEITASTVEILSPAMATAYAAMSRAINSRGNIEASMSIMESTLPDFPDFDNLPPDTGVWTVFSDYMRKAIPHFYAQYRNIFLEYHATLRDFYDQQEGRRELKTDIRTINALPALEMTTRQD